MKYFVIIFTFVTFGSIFFCSFVTAMEKLLHYVWKHKLFPLKMLTTTDGRSVEVIDSGLHNHNAGPDFFNAKIRIAGTDWVGNVELHMKASQWYQHGHDKDEVYDNVILHVVSESDQDVYDSKGHRLNQMVVKVPDYIKENYSALLREDRYPRCYRMIPEIDRLTIHSWMSALVTERMERKSTDIYERLKQANGSWEDAFFQTLARNYGFGVNSEAFEAWAKSFPIQAVGHHRDDLFQIEAMFLGQAGLLDIYAIQERYREKADFDLHFKRLKAEYNFLSHKFGLTPIDYKMWKYLRLRPQNFPQIRLSQLATLYFNRKGEMSELLECTTIEQLTAALSTEATEYWNNHYVFGEESEPCTKKMSKSSKQLIILNTVIPLLFAYGRYKQSETYVARAIDLLEQLKAEDNNIVRLWKECGLSVNNAADSQALIQLKKEYCDKKDCLRCRIGYRYLKKIRD